MPKVGSFPTISGAELRQRIDQLGLTYAEAARRLGLTENGLHKQMSGARRIGRQTEIILDCLEHHPPTTGGGNPRQTEQPRDRQAGPVPLPDRTATEMTDRSPLK